MCHHLAAANTMRIATRNFHLGETRIQKRPRQQNGYHPNSALRRAAGWRESREEKAGLAPGQWRETLLDCDLRRQRDTESLRGFLWILENLGCEGVRDHLRGEPASLSVLPRPRQHASRRPWTCLCLANTEEERRRHDAVTGVGTVAPSHRAFGLLPPSEQVVMGPPPGAVGPVNF